MRYKNYTNEAIYEMERQRTLDYGNMEVEEALLCDNGCYGKTLYSADGKILCEDCIIEEVRDIFDDILSSEEEGFPIEIIKDIISDFSDSEILTYIENRYDKIF